MRNLRVGVIGAGVVGLTTAVELKREFRNATLELISEKFYDEITSYAAGGIFSPEGGTPGGTEERTRKWLRNAYDYWDNIRLSPESEEAGVRQISGYIFSSEYPHIVRNKYLEELVPLYRAATEDELQMYPGNWRYGSYFTTLQTDPTRYLRWALNKINNSDIRVIRKKVLSFTELANEYDILVNCAGMGSKFLCEDKSLFPLRGQVTLVRAPWVENFIFGEWDTYIIPAFDSTIIGGCRQYESYNVRPNLYDGLSIRERCESMLPSLKEAPLIEHRVGLRSYRVPTRVEKEHIFSNGKEMKIIHNYGHGGYGVTLAPGTALNVVELATEYLTERLCKL